MRYRRDIVFQVTLSCVQKYEIEDESHEMFRCNAYDRFRKEVNIIASVSAMQDTSNAPSHVMAALQTTKSLPVIQIPHFLYRILDMRNRAIGLSSERMESSPCPTGIKTMEV